MALHPFYFGEQKMKKYLITTMLVLALVYLIPKPAQARPRLTDQQVGVLVAFKLYPAWVRQQTGQGALVYGVVKPEDRVPARVAGDSYLIADGDTDGPILYYQVSANGRQVVIESAAHRGGHLATRKLKLKQLIQQFYYTRAQRQVVNAAVSALRTE